LSELLVAHPARGTIRTEQSERLAHRCRPWHVELVVFAHPLLLGRKDGELQISAFTLSPGGGAMVVNVPRMIATVLVGLDLEVERSVHGLHTR
jgi:hypothetical protein